MENVVGTLVAGLVGTSLMSLLMGTIHAAGWANADMIRALGSLVTRSKEHALGWGITLHYLAGLLFAFPYTVILGAFGRPGVFLTLGLGALIGFVHGLVMSLILLAAVSEKHPLEEFRDAGFEVGVAHIFGHVAYGIGVAAVVLLLNVDWGFSI